MIEWTDRDTLTLLKDYEQSLTEKIAHRSANISWLKQKWMHNYPAFDCFGIGRTYLKKYARSIRHNKKMRDVFSSRKIYIALYIEQFKNERGL